MRCISATCASKLVHEFIVCVVNRFGTQKKTLYDCITLTVFCIPVHTQLIGEMYVISD